MFIISNSFLGHYEINLDVGVSNTAGTLNFTNNMNKDAIIFWGSLFVWWIILSAIMISMAKSCTSNNNSPVERIHHDEIVTVVDSILDARFGPGCCEEVIDSDDVSIPQRLFSSQKFVDIAE